MRLIGSIESSMQEWPRESFALAHLGELMAITCIESYRGAAGRWEWLEQQRARLDRAFLLRTSWGLTNLCAMRITAALSGCLGAPAPRRAVLLAEAARQVTVLSRSRVPTALLLSTAFEAQVLAVRGDREHALEKAARARRLGEAHMAWNQHQNAYLEGLLEGGDAGREKREAALAVCAAEGWRNARRALSMLYPALDYLEGGRS